ncbi:MAG: 3-isopropylmalate dehydratase small subunit [Ilumatobacteraceae bacterium]
MQPFVTLTSVAAPLAIANINTDDIFPAPATSPIKLGRAGASRDELGKNAFAVWRWNADETPRPEFVLNQPPFDQAAILVTLDNFGCGSSREMAVWTLLGTGIRCVIAPSFGDIFYGNCCKNGLLPVRLGGEDVAALLALVDVPGGALVTVDLTAQQVTGPDDSVHRFEIEPYHRTMLLAGLDEIAATLQRADAIEHFEQDYDRRRPWVAASGPPT